MSERAFHDLVAKVERGAVSIVLSAVDLDVGSRRRAAFGKRLDVVKLQEPGFVARSV